MDSCAIEIKDLTKFYGSQRGIEGIDLSVAAGEVVGFLGPNGAGKTTTIRLLLDLLRPQRGTARVLGLDCQKQGLEVRRRIGYLPGEYRLYENLTGEQILSFLGNVGGHIDWSYTHELAERLGIELSRSIRTLSHGNKQKLAIILAFQHRAPLLILDEPTNGLDPLVQQEFFSLVADARSEGRTVFLSSHNLTEVERVCDRVASVREGRLVAVHEIAAIRDQALRVVTMTCARPIDERAFAHLEGLVQPQFDGPVLRASIRGSLGPVIAAAVPFEILDLLSHEATLEEFFLAMYGDRKARDAR